MEKRAVVLPGLTPAADTQAGKRAAAGTVKDRTEALDRDFTKQAADAAAGKLSRHHGS